MSEVLVVRTEFWEGRSDEEVRELFEAVLGEDVEIAIIDPNQKSERL